MINGCTDTCLLYTSVLPVVVSEGFLKELFDSIHADPKMEVEVNLPEQTRTNKATGKSEHFEINAYKKHCLMNGLDDIDFLLTNKDKIEAVSYTHLDVYKRQNLEIARTPRNAFRCSLAGY